MKNIKVIAFDADDTLWAKAVKTYRKHRRIFILKTVTPADAGALVLLVYESATF